MYYLIYFFLKRVLGLLEESHQRKIVAPASAERETKITSCSQKVQKNVSVVLTVAWKQEQNTRGEQKAISECNVFTSDFRQKFWSCLRCNRVVNGIKSRCSGWRREKKVAKFRPAIGFRSKLWFDKNAEPCSDKCLGFQR